jgi:phage gp46-like protein
MRVDHYQGDPRLTLDENGADLDFLSGQPVMDAGLENAVLISLFTREGWAGNSFFSEPSKQIGATFEETTELPITLANLNRMRSAGELALSWMIDAGMASDISVKVTNPTGKSLQVEVLIRPPTGDVQRLVLVKNGPNWINQAVAPAYLRLRQ